MNIQKKLQKLDKIDSLIMEIKYGDLKDNSLIVKRLKSIMKTLMVEWDITETMFEDYLRRK